MSEFPQYPAAKPPQNFGWIRPEERTEEMQAADAMALAQMPVFEIVGNYKDAEKALLYEARQKLAGKDDPAYIWQSTGSCVGAGGGNCNLTLMDVEILLKGEPEQQEMLWWLFTYGESREIAGMRGQGDGSFGSAYAKAWSQRGTFAADVEAELPKFQNRQGWYYLSSSIEYKWSDGFSIPSKWNEHAKEHRGTTAKINNADQVAEALLNGYPLTCASMFGTRGPKIKGEPPVLLAEWDGRWAHQMFIDGYWDHPTLGPIFRIGNNWGPSAHGKDPAGSPAGGFWVRKAVMDRICRDEVFAFSAYNGFPAQNLWYDIV